MRSKTPEARATPIPMEIVSEDESEDLSQPPKTPDIHLSDTEDVPQTPSPRLKSKKSSAMEALAALGLDEFVGEIKIKERKENKKEKLSGFVGIDRKLDDSRSDMNTEKKSVQNKNADKNNYKDVTVNDHKSEKFNDRTNELNDKRKRQKMEIINGDHYSEKVSDSLLVDNVSKYGSVKLGKDEALEIDVEDEPSRSSPESQIQMEHSYSLPRERDPSSSNSPASESEIKKKQEAFTLDHDYTTKSKSPLTPKLDDNKFGKTTVKEIKKSSEKLISHLLDTYLKPEKVTPVKYKERNLIEEMTVLYEFLTKG